ncbi:MAG: hypothetical protein E4G96_07030 [Chrysiogenales bacterium]|nr:MAG: hypothetical protein E4G96_07030 [Chrysiogenales bacterium]
MNIILGVLLLLFPVGIIDLLGLPPTNTNFYPSILGAVLLDIGAALFLKAAGFAKGIRGLGLGGAIVINIIGSFVLICWLIFGSLVIPLKGRIILWAIGVGVSLIGIAELVTKSWVYDDQ